MSHSSQLRVFKHCILRKPQEEFSVFTSFWKPIPTLLPNGPRSSLSYFFFFWEYDFYQLVSIYEIFFHLHWSRTRYFLVEVVRSRISLSKGQLISWNLVCGCQFLIWIDSIKMVPKDGNINLWHWFTLCPRVLVRR